MAEITTLGSKLSPILEELEEIILEHSSNNGIKPDYTKEGFRAGLMIFHSVLSDKMFEKQMNDGKTIEQAEKEAELMGYEVRALILKYTNIDTHEIY